ncbi:hypothetical protein CesoFtcFv8_009597 [Champsocephalus esox]|uniref:Uncharacterized protein n=1 Tax=Champsocephalus esox TaxID=159716 RepID=A0AAN8H2M1_9TELE|nr:hypothetical protein CesoFtcFv8_009597 [Champsocephalus esox]
MRRRRRGSSHARASREQCQMRRRRRRSRHLRDVVMEGLSLSHLYEGQPFRQRERLDSHSYSRDDASSLL